MIYTITTNNIKTVIAGLEVIHNNVKDCTKELRELGFTCNNKRYDSLIEISGYMKDANSPEIVDK